MIKWEKGRQNSGYEKLTLFKSNLLKCDAYIIRYKKGSYIPEHVDPVDKEFNHHRLNIVLRKSSLGGDLYINETKIDKRIILFRPDKDKHSVSEIKGSTRYILSFGWLSKQK